MYLQPIVGRDTLSLGASPLDAEFVKQYNNVAVDVESASDDSDHHDNNEESDDESDNEIEPSSDDESDDERDHEIDH